MGRFSEWMKTVNKKVLITRFLIVLSFLLCAVGVALFLAGTATCGHTLVNVTEAFTMSFRFFQTMKPTYQSISEMCLGFLYILVLIIVIRKLILIAKYSTVLLWKEKKSSNESLFLLIQKHSAGAFVGMFFVALCCNLVKKSKNHVHLTILIILAFLVLIIWNAIQSIHRHNPVTTVLLEIACLLFFLVPLFLVVRFSQTNTAEVIFDKVKVFSALRSRDLVEKEAIIALAYEVFELVISAYYLIVMLLAIRVYAKANTRQIFRNPALKRPVKVILTTAISLVIVSFVLFMIDGGTITFDNLVKIWKPYMALVFAGAALYISTFQYDKILINKKLK